MSNVFRPKSPSGGGLDLQAPHAPKTRPWFSECNLQPYFSLHEGASGREAHCPCSYAALQEETFSDFSALRRHLLTGFTKKRSSSTSWSVVFKKNVRGKNFSDVGAHNSASKMSVI